MTTRYPRKTEECGRERLLIKILDMLSFIMEPSDRNYYFESIFLPSQEIGFLFLSATTKKPFLKQIY